MNELQKVREILKQPNFRWLPKHLNHIAESIKFKNRNVSFLAINAIFRSDNFRLFKAPAPFESHFTINAFMPILPNDLLRTKAENLTVVFYLDKNQNIIPITAYSESDEN